MSRQIEFRRRQVYGLLLVLSVLLVIGLVRAGLAPGGLRNVFPPGWWRAW